MKEYSALVYFKDILKRLEDSIDEGVVTHYQVAEIAPEGLIEALYAADYALQQEKDHKTRDFTQEEMDLMVKDELHTEFTFPEDNP